MKRINNFPFYELGAAITPLHELNQATKTLAVSWPMVRAQFALRTFLDEKVIPLSFSRQTAQELYVELNSIIPLGGQVPTIGPEQELGFSGYQIAEKAKTFEHELAAELRQLDTISYHLKEFFLPPTGLLPVSKTPS